MDILHLLPAWYTATLGALLGGAIASFAGVIAERVPAGESLGGRSRCVCGRQLRISENIPVVGWVAVRGVARCCGARMPAWYVVTEAATAVMWGAAGWFAGMTGIATSAAVTAAVVAAVTFHKGR